MSGSSQGQRLTKQILAAIVLAVAFALLLPVLVRLGLNPDYLLTPLRLGGEIFLRVLKMLVVPLVVASVMTGILGMGDIRNLGRPGLLTIVFYLSTTFLAVSIGLMLVNVIGPGRGAVSEQELAEVRARQESQNKLYTHLSEETGLDESQVAKILGDEAYADRQNPSLSRVMENLVLMLVTDNLFRSAANMDLLPLILFSIVFAGMLSILGSKVQTIIDFTNQINDVLIRMVMLVMQFGPLGIFCLVAARFGQSNAQGQFLAELKQTGGYFITVMSGLAIHALIALPLILYLFTGRNPYRFILQMSRALLTAFATSSSSATLPVTMEVAVEEAGVSKKSVDFVLPLGATVNMDGTALYEIVAALFIAQALGMDLTMGEQLVAAVTAAMAAIGAAGIPQAGLVTMVIVLNSIGVPPEYLSLVLAVDWLVDRFRTVVNVFGDCCGAAIIERFFEPEGPATLLVTAEGVPVGVQAQDLPGDPA